MYYIGNAVKRVADFYNQINSATLTGAIDIVVVKQEDGTFIGSPFHVRFGKLGVLSSREKVVEIAINDVEVDLQMKLGVAGEAFFVERANRRESVPVNLATSPIPSQMHLLESTFHFEINERDHLDNDFMSDDQDLPVLSTPVSRTASLPIKITKTSLHESRSSISRSIAIPNTQSLTVSRIHHLQSDYPLSDMDSPISTPLSRSPEDIEVTRQIFSDTEIDTAQSSRKVSNPNVTWEWGMLPEGTKRSPKDKSTSIERKKKADRLNKSKQNKSSKHPPSEGLLLDEVLAADKEVADLYLHRASSAEGMDLVSERQSTPIASSISLDDQNKDDTLPISEDELIEDVSMSLCGDLKSRRVEPDKFLEALVTYEMFCENPEILNDPKLVIKIDDRYYNWHVAGPYLMSHLIYQRPLPSGNLRKLKQKFMPKKRRGWFSSWQTQQQEESSDEEKMPKPIGSSLHKLTELEDADSDTARVPSGDDVEDTEFKKTLRLTSDQWKSLNLNYGVNKVNFTVTTRLQGTATCDARIFLWDYTDKIIVSDIDGTITRSDVLGQILPVVGKDWFQADVTGLFSTIERNAYHFMYLSARAIGQAQITREFLKNVKQGELTLPDGPVLLTPTSLFSAFKKEVIERKPEEFKIACMRDIRHLFPENSNPLHAGFGNRINDVWAYRAVGIPISRIFTINYQGELKHELTKTFSSSYTKLIDLVDQMFPPVNSWKTVDSSRSDYTAFMYWRAPVPEITDLKNIDDFEFP